MGVHHSLPAHALTKVYADLMDDTGIQPLFGEGLDAVLFAKGRVRAAWNISL